MAQESSADQERHAHQQQAALYSDLRPILPPFLPPAHKRSHPSCPLPAAHKLLSSLHPPSVFPPTTREEEEEKEDEEEKEEGEEEGEDAVAVPPPPHGRTRLSHPRHHSRTHARTHGQRVKGKLPLQPDSVLT